jgi:uncharacterized protein (UPF0212 family)
MTKVLSIPVRKEAKGWAYCPICTHTVEATVVLGGRKAYVKPGSKCPRCTSSLEAGVVIRTEPVAA